MYPIPRDILKGPSVAMIVLGIVNGLLALIYAIVWLAGLAVGQQQHTFGSESEQAGYYVGWIGGLAISIVCLITSPVILYAGVQMGQAKSYGLCKTGAILAAIPCTSFCCIAGIPIGIWAVVTLNKPEVKAGFDMPTQQPPYHPQPPSPPPFQQPPPGSN
jgi:hypothetical protein